VLNKKGFDAAGYEIDVGGTSTPGRTFCRIGTDVISNVVSSYFEGTNDGKWHHVACVVDRLANTFSIYGDGMAVGSPVDISTVGSLETKRPA
jgi:hypothetical protein